MFQQVQTSNHLLNCHMRMVTRAPFLNGLFKSWIFVNLVTNWERTIEKTRVGFRRTEVSIPQFWSFCSRSTRWAWFHAYRGQTTVNKLETWNWKKLGSDLVVQRSRYHHFEAFFEIYKMGMISEATKNELKVKKLGSDLVVQRSRYYHFGAFFKIY